MVAWTLATEKAPVLAALLRLKLPSRACGVRTQALLVANADATFIKLGVHRDYDSSSAFDEGRLSLGSPPHDTQNSSDSLINLANASGDLKRT